MEEVRGMTLKDVLIRLVLIVIFIFLLIWLFPMPNLKPLNNQIFTDNILIMKDVAKSYYTIERLPKELNGKVRMTLREMLDQKFTLELMDSNGNYCNAENSYIEITKLENEYVIKTYLSCSDKEDYVIEHYGCYDICGDKCIELSRTTRAATTIADRKTTVCKQEPTYKPGTSYRPGTTYIPGTSREDTTRQTTHKDDIYEYLHKKTTYKEVFDKYACNISGYNLIGDKCVKTTAELIKVPAKTKTETQTETLTNVSLSKVVYNDRQVAAIETTVNDVSTTYSCPSGSTVISGSNMCSTTSTTYPSKVCPSNTSNIIYSSKNTSECNRSQTVYVYKENYTVSSNSYWKYVGYATFPAEQRIRVNVNYNGIKYTDELLVWQYSCVGCSSTDAFYKYKKHQLVTDNVTGKRCPSGYTNYDANRCYKVVKTTVGKVCPGGSTNHSATHCKSTSSTQVAKVSNTISTPRKVLTCPIGTTATSNQRVCNKKEASIEKYCVNGYVLSANGYTCSKTVTNTIEKKYCENNDYVLSGNSCIKIADSTDVRPATKVNKIESTLDYKWTSSDYLKGWIYTGDKRQIN